MAPRKTTRIVRNPVYLDYKSLRTSDVLCPICRNILIEPVTLPCNHNFCLLCFNTQTLQKNVVCPSCKIRVSSWLRSATKSNKLINERLWKAIQHRFEPHAKSKSGLNKQKLNGGVSEKGNLARQINDGGEFHLSVKEKRANNKIEVNNFANKEYSCRILCQSVGNEAKQINVENMQMRNKQIQKITQIEISDRSDSIESECIYFKPINYRQNPPSEGLAPIKVPSKKPPINSQMKIIPPSGKNQFTISPLDSAFVRLCLLHEAERPSPSPEIPVKRKSKKQFKKQKSKMRSKSPPFKGFAKGPEVPTSSSPPFKGFSQIIKSRNSSPYFKGFKLRSNEIASLNCVERKLAQEQLDYQLALKLQDAYNNVGKSTRSRDLKQVATTTTIACK